MPATRPEAISDLIRLAYEARAAVRSLIPKDGAVDSALAAVVDEFAPDPHSVSALGSQDDLFTGSDELGALTPVSISMGAVVPLVHGEAVFIAVLREPPQRFIQWPLA
jgi:hypothetical protein